jgi:hypothetical protein
MRNAVVVASLALLALSSPAAGQEARSAASATAPLQVREIGSLHVGGRIATVEGLPERELAFSPGAPPTRINPNGQFPVEGMYAQYVKLQEPRARYPLLLWHGGGLTGVTWETTPDGRPGWQMFFLRAGHDVYVSDAMERGRSGWRASPRCFRASPSSAPWARAGACSASASSPAGTRTRRAAPPFPRPASRSRTGTSS